jgi:ribosomal protein S18 acetylase RimI-like enzyme
MTHSDLSRTIRSKDSTLRVRPWRGRPDVVVAGPTPGNRPTATQVNAAIERLLAAGVRQVFTTALGPPEQQPFIAAGFNHHEHLHLLRHDLRMLPRSRPGTHHRLRRGLRRDYNSALDVDAVAFEGFWQFDLRSLVEARNATPTSRFRVAAAPTDGPWASGSPVAGYAVTGRANRTCYLQRLAVHPDRQRDGLGTALVCDALQWARARRADEILVNTQQSNTTAFQLYLGLGFHNQTDGLDVLHRNIQ